MGYGRYILLACTWLHIGIHTTGFRSTYTTEALPQTCPKFEDVAQKIDKGNMEFTYHNAFKYTTGQTTDEDQSTCDKIYRRKNRQPFITVEMNKQIPINYLRIIFHQSSAKRWRVNSPEINSCKRQCITQNWHKRTIVFNCAGPPIKGLIITWDGLESIVCEIQIFTDKKCADLPQVGNGSYITSSATNMSGYPFEVGTNATLQCSEGYEPSESQPITIECYANGQWSFSNVTCKETPNTREGDHQQYLIYVPIGISVLIVAVIALILLNIKQISIYMRKPNQGQVMGERSDFKDEDDDDPLCESVTPVNSITRTTNDCNNTKPQNVFMLKPMETRCTSSRSSDCVSLYENIYARPDIIEHTTTNRNSCNEMSTVCNNSVPSERSDSSEFVINDLYEPIGK